jgi:hypothetical protein
VIVPLYQASSNGQNTSILSPIRETLTLSSLSRRAAPRDGTEGGGRGPSVPVPVTLLVLLGVIGRCAPQAAHFFFEV